MTSVGAELEVQLGAGHEELVVVAAAEDGREDRLGHAADRREGVDRAVEVVIVFEAQPQTLEPEGRRRTDPTEQTTDRQRPLDTTAESPAGAVLGVGQTTGGVNEIK
jgi:hypothetical protein